MNTTTGPGLLSRSHDGSGSQEPTMAPFDDDPFTLTSAPATASYSAKDEMNFAEFPIALVTDRVDKSMDKTLRFEDKVFDVGKNQFVTRRLVITASDEYGLPTAKDD